MPIIDVSIAAGRTPEQLRSLMSELHNAAVKALDAPPASVRVLLREVELDHWLSGGETLAEKAAQK